MPSFSSREQMSSVDSSSMREEVQKRRASSGSRSFIRANSSDRSKIRVMAWGDIFGPSAGGAGGVSGRSPRRRQHRLYFWPLPHGQGALRPVLPLRRARFFFVILTSRPGGKSPGYGRLL